MGPEFGFKKICTTWNIGVRTVLKLPFDTHSTFETKPLSTSITSKEYKILYNMYYSNNTIVRSCFNHAIVNVNSCIGAKLGFFTDSWRWYFQA